MYDARKLIACTDITAVCDYLGINVYRHGSSARIDCPNPEHNEKHHDNCSLYEDEGRFYCYSCLVKGNAIDMIMLNRGCSFKDAVNILAEINGVSDDSLVLDKSSLRNILSKSDQEFLGIQVKPVYGLKRISDCYDSECSKCEDLNIPNKYSYACFDEIMSNPLIYLYDTNPEAYQSLVRGKAEEKLEYWERFQQLTHISADKEINRALSLLIKHGGAYKPKKRCLLGEAAEEVSSLF